ncbi:MAG: YkvA family protein [Acidobacteriota bacterium]
MIDRDPRQPVSFQATHGNLHEERHLAAAKPASQLRRLAREVLYFLPNLLKLTYRLVRDPRVPQTDKIILAATVAYVLTPLDVLPDFIPFFGQIDDSYLLAVALLRLLSRTPGEVLAKHWEGPGDIRPLLNRIIALTTFFLPKRVRQVIAGQVKPLPRS